MIKMCFYDKSNNSTIVQYEVRRQCRLHCSVELQRLLHNPNARVVVS